MLGVCFHREKSWEQDQWSFVFSNFGVTDIWELGKDDDKDYKLYQETTAISSAEELPLDSFLIVMTPAEGRYIKGREPLENFDHPEHAVYLFGASHKNLSDELGTRDPDALVYIPTVQHEMYSHAAAYITLYDRMVKRGGFG